MSRVYDTENEDYDRYEEVARDTPGNSSLAACIAPASKRRYHSEGLEMPGGPGPDVDKETEIMEMSANPRENYWYQPVTKGNYLAAIMNIAPVLTPTEPTCEIAAIKWDPLTLEKGILLFDDPRAQVRMCMWPNLFENMDSIEDLLNLAIRYGIPFNLFFKMSEILLFQEKARVTDLECRTMPGTLEPDYSDTNLTWLGGVNTLARYLDLAAILLKWLYAGAFLMMGGLANHIALWIEKTLPGRFAKGPSSRITEYNRGFMRKAVVQPELAPVDLTRDQVSGDDMKLLFGATSKGSLTADLTLFLEQWMCDEWAPGHFCGIMTPAAQAIFEDICCRISTHAIDDCWKTQGQWHLYLCSAYQKEYAPKDWPQDEDFA
ncbi:hypothetical protein B0H17DRAFT_1207663 [Mycena rosella]|uniref:Uncharacterized protein n=1 Tax=Mycena rosella TaxID=1033263 RepID=A0AAD7G7R3_MYCRO|nr:hypothetical protein B0H17DRAFT_1207663 [Mycena rosella]